MIVRDSFSGASTTVLNWGNKTDDDDDDDDNDDDDDDESIQSGPVLVNCFYI